MIEHIGKNPEILLEALKRISQQSAETGDPERPIRTMPFELMPILARVALEKWERALPEEKIDETRSRLKRAEGLILYLASLRAPDGGRRFPADHMIDEALAWVGEALDGSEGERREDRLYKTSRYLLDYIEEQGLESFRRRFGTNDLDIIATCRHIIEEGEGSPHPWPGSEEE